MFYFVSKYSCFIYILQVENYTRSNRVRKAFRTDFRLGNYLRLTNRRSRRRTRREIVPEVIGHENLKPTRKRGEVVLSSAVACESQTCKKEKENLLHK